MDGFPDPISPADRALIDRHIAEHGVTVVLRGVSGFADGDYALGGRANLNFFKSSRKVRKLRRRGRQIDWGKRERYRSLVESGKNIDEIAEAMGVGRGGAYSMLALLGLRASQMRGRIDAS